MTGSRAYAARGCILLLAVAVFCCIAGRSQDTEGAGDASAAEVAAPDPEAAPQETSETGEAAAEDTFAPEPGTEAPEPAATTPQEDSSPPVAPIEAAGLDEVNQRYREAAGDAEEGETTTRRETVEARGFSPYIQGLAALCILCGAIILLGWLARKLGGNTPLLAGQRYGKVLGRVALSPRAALHFVESADRVLVIGVTQQSISLISEFPREAFGEVVRGETEDAPLRAPDFLEHLRSAGDAGPSAAGADDEMDVLRGDLQRLQQYLKQRSGGDV